MNKRLLFLLVVMLPWQIFGAGLAHRKWNSMQRFAEAYAAFLNNCASQVENYTLKGMQAFTGRRLSKDEIKLFRLQTTSYNKRMAAGEEADQATRIKRTRRLAIGSLIGVGVGIGLVFLLPGVGIALLAAGTVCGFVAKSNAKTLQDERAKNMGNIAAIAGIAGIVAFTVIIILATVTFLALLFALGGG
jgi:hypothetical protein